MAGGAQLYQKGGFNGVILGGSTVERMTLDVAGHLGMDTQAIDLQKQDERKQLFPCGRFPGGEVSAHTTENLRGRNVYILVGHAAMKHPDLGPISPNDAIIEGNLMADMAKRASAKRVTMVVPYLGYMRQDRKTRGREPVSAWTVIHGMKEAGVDHIVSVDLHTGQLSAFGGLAPFDNLTGNDLLAQEARQLRENLQDSQGLVIVAPDLGNIKVVDDFARGLGEGVASAAVIKERNHDGSVDTLGMFGDVNGKDCIILDDMIATGGTIVNAAEALRQHGARSVRAYAVHGLFAGAAERKFREYKGLDEVVTTDTIDLGCPMNFGTTAHRRLTVAPLLAQTIQIIESGKGSVSELFRQKATK